MTLGPYAIRRMKDGHYFTGFHRVMDFWFAEKSDQARATDHTEAKRTSTVLARKGISNTIVSAKT
jgi:hypothetical protein